ncbi:MAG TPA: D-alanyl-D-alanine carboxypeptidase/D-alanyl-D-alanine-endopeptidase, partial [Solirubrobacteraceae bacterium]|nr:D-alanyl-D-alanine carboxypeptidase/D-alanyl-D-alanine-endopeptidase [Solirubrobacteraceae bacterium]
MPALVSLVLLAAVPAGAVASPASALRSLRASLRRAIAAAGGAGGVLVFDRTSGRTLFSLDPNVRRLPASVEKLYTTTTALLQFGPRTRLRTAVYGDGSLSGGTWHGTLYLRGAGDPTFGSQSFDRSWYGTGATVQTLARNLARTGVRTVAGPIVGDETIFDSLRGTPATRYRANLEVEGELSGLSFDSGFTSASGSALQAHPALFATRQFAAALRRRGISVPAGVRISAGRTPASAQLLASVASPPMARLIELTNSPSDNFFAETLLKDLGARFGGGGSTPRGAAVVRSFIARRFGLDPLLNDGSGLSRYDGTSPAQVVSLLGDMQSNSWFWNSLAIAGVRGTMRYEMTGTRAVNNCRGKTGTLSDVANLAGYCTARNGDKLVFAFLLSRQSNPGY